MLMDIDVAAVRVSIFMMDTLMQLCVNIILYDLCIIFEYKPQYTENRRIFSHVRQWLSNIHILGKKKVIIDKWELSCLNINYEMPQQQYESLGVHSKS